MDIHLHTHLVSGKINSHGHVSMKDITSELLHYSALYSWPRRQIGLLP